MSDPTHAVRWVNGRLAVVNVKTGRVWRGPRSRESCVVCGGYHASSDCPEFFYEAFPTTAIGEASR